MEMQIKNERGRLFRICILQKGEKYGLNNSQTHKDDMPVVQFFDLTHVDKFGKEGQFVSSYFVDTFMEVENGLSLDGGEPAWVFYEKETKIVQDWVKHNLDL